MERDPSDKKTTEALSFESPKTHETADYYSRTLSQYYSRCNVLEYGTPSEASKPAKRIPVKIDSKALIIKEIKLMSSFKVMVSNHEVLFAKEPLDSQEHFIKAMLPCLENKCNALLECPEGGGATQAIIIGALSALKIKLEADQNYTGKVFYFAKSHSRLTRVSRV